ncbi:MAG: hypothetical protein HY077_03795 [Elusimicrobia bacterium]|nr:hypothetical protein [Elusimicrobiota bacterium]
MTVIGIDKPNGPSMRTAPSCTAIRPARMQSLRAGRFTAARTARSAANAIKGWEAFGTGNGRLFRSRLLARKAQMHTAVAAAR